VPINSKEESYLGSFGGKVDSGAEVGGFDTFPAGTYELELIEGEVKPTKDGDGELFTHRIHVIEGQYEKRLIFGNMNLVNKNATAQKIGQGEFLALRTVTGALEVPDDELEPEDMCFKRFTGVVKIIPAKAGFDAKNAVNWPATFKLFQQQQNGGGAAANDNAAPSTAANDNANTGGAKRTPWGKNKAA
jgi:hypothetical protein